MSIEDKKIDLINQIVKNETAQELLKADIAALEARLIDLETQRENMECDMLDLQEGNQADENDSQSTNAEFYIDLDQTANGDTMH